MNIFFLSKEHDIFNSKTTYKTFQQIILSNFSTSENKKKKYFEKFLNSKNFRQVQLVLLQWSTLYMETEAKGPMLSNIRYGYWIHLVYHTASLKIGHQTMDRMFSCFRTFQICLDRYRISLLASVVILICYFVSIWANTYTITNQKPELQLWQ